MSGVKGKTGTTREAQQSRIEARSDYIKKYVNNSPLRTNDAVNKIADKLFLSESMVYKDLAR